MAAVVDNQDEIRLKVLDVVNTFQCMSQYYDMNLFFSNATNNKAIYDAYLKYGIPPKAEFQDVKVKVYDTKTKSYVDKIEKVGACSWDKGMYRFYLAAQLFQKYPKFDFKDTKNCEKTKNLKLALDEEKVFVDNQHVADQDYTKYQYTTTVLNDYQSELNGILATLNCNKVISQEQQQEQLDIIDKASTSSVSESTTSNVGNYIVYGVVILVAIVVARRLLKKD